MKNCVLALVLITLSHVAQADVCNKSNPQVCRHASEDGKSIRYTMGSQSCECDTARGTRTCTCTGPVQASGKDGSAGYTTANAEFNTLNNKFYGN